MNHEEKLKQLGQRYEARKREADTKKGALLNTVEALKAEHGIETAEDAQILIDELLIKVSAWEKERDQLISKIDNTLSGRDVAQTGNIEESGNKKEYAGTTCSICHKSQFKTSSGLTCENGHGGADSKDDDGFEVDDDDDFESFEV